MTRPTLIAILISALLLLAFSLWAQPAYPETNYAKAKRIVFAVFPDATQEAALRVVGCETGYTYSPWSYNRGSGASGYFQILQGNAGRVLYHRGERLVIPSGRRLFLPWTNARVALFLSRGGTDWGEWSCKP